MTVPPAAVGLSLSGVPEPVPVDCYAHVLVIVCRVVCAEEHGEPVVVDVAVGDGHVSGVVDDVNCPSRRIVNLAVVHPHTRATANGNHVVVAWLIADFDVVDNDVCHVLEDKPCVLDVDINAPPVDCRVR